YFTGYVATAWPGLNSCVPSERLDLKWNSARFPGRVKARWPARRTSRDSGAAAPALSCDAKLARGRRGGQRGKPSVLRRCAGPAAALAGLNRRPSGARYRWHLVVPRPWGTSPAASYLLVHGRRGGAPWERVRPHEKGYHSRPREESSCDIRLY